MDVISGGSGYAETDTITVIPVPGSGGSGAVLTMTIITVVGSVDTVHYYNVWNGIETDRLVLLQIEFIVNYFTCLGYNFQVQTNPETGNTLQWFISW